MNGISIYTLKKHIYGRNTKNLWHMSDNWESTFYIFWNRRWAYKEVSENIYEDKFYDRD